MDDDAFMQILHEPSDEDDDNDLEILFSAAGVEATISDEFDKSFYVRNRLVGKPC